MSEQFKAEARRIFEEAYNNGDLDALDDLFAPHVIVHRSPVRHVVGLAAFKQSLVEARSIYSDLNLSIDEILLEGENKGASRWTLRGTHTGQSQNLPIPPTGKQVVYTGSNIFHLQGGKIVEAWEHGDYLGLLQQLGVVPPLTSIAA